jgi:serine/threonine-protein kinase
VRERAKRVFGPFLAIEYDSIVPLICVQCHRDIDEAARICAACGALQPARDRRLIGTGSTVDVGYGRYVVEARVGEGGMGVVWRGWLFHSPAGPRGKEPAEPVALKVLRPQAQMREDMRTLFLNEAESLRRLSHPNIVRYYDLIEWGAQTRPETSPRSGANAEMRPSNAPPDGALVLAIEYVQGDTLENVIARHVARARLAGGGLLPGMPFRRAWYYFEQLLGALAAIHALGIVHRDVKPSNILIRHDGIVKLTDFGIARLAEGDAGSLVAKSAASGAGADVAMKIAADFAPGTGAYMSPEQVLAKPLDGRSDLYSAATVLYEMLSGKTPFSPDRGEFMVRHDQVEAPPPPIRTWLAQAPPVLDALFARALAKDPSYRFADAIEMGEAFRTALGLQATPEWRAQVDIARAAAEAPDTKRDPGDANAAHEQRMATLREFVVRGYRTARMGAM